MKREYIVWRPDYGQTKEDGRHIDASDSERACQLWAEREDSESADYSIVSGTPADVRVALAEEGATVEAFTVYGESMPQYRAHAKRPLGAALDGGLSSGTDETKESKS